MPSASADVVARLRSEGMTQQAIADALGVSTGAVAGDCQFLSTEKLDDVPQQPDAVVGKDGTASLHRVAVLGPADRPLPHLR